jgi:hypothetical protein
VRRREGKGQLRPSKRYAIELYGWARYSQKVLSALPSECCVGVMRDVRSVISVERNVVSESRVDSSKGLGGQSRKVNNDTGIYKKEEGKQWI